MDDKAKMQPALKPWERRIIHTSYVLEQLLGERLSRALVRPWKEKALAALLARLEKEGGNAPLPPRQVDRRETLSAAEFKMEYFSRGLPVIFSGAARDWPCVRKWSLDFFSTGYGEQPLLLVDAPGLTGRMEKPGYEFLSLRKLVDSIRSAGSRYLRFSPLLHENPELVRDLDMDWLERMRGGDTFARTYYMFMGGDGQRTLLHNDQPCNLFVQARGEKKWTLFMPGDSALLYPEITNTAYVKSQVDLASPDAGRHPLLRFARPMLAHLRPGDVLYVPPFVWHEVENLGETVAVGYRYSSLRAAARSSLAFLLIRALSTNPPVWKTMRYGKQDTNLIWAHTGGFIKEVLAERALRRAARK